MADNITISTATSIATDEVNGEHYQYMKLADGTADSAAVIPGDATYGLDVDVTRLPAITGEVAITDTYAPVGSHSSGATISSATTLTKPTGANSIMIQALTQNVRFTLDGTDPTASVGFQILAGNAPMIIAVPGASIKVIQEAATASLQYQWLG